MTRRLPWTPTTNATHAPPKRKPASKAPKRELSSPDSDATAKKAVSPAQSKLEFEKTPKRKHGSRSPSSSPIRGPPTASPMRPGYDQDDIFMMVEDELHAVAQTFTHHLHAAEYKRLKKKAREAPPRTLPTLSATAPRKVKRKFEVMTMRDKQKAALTEDREEKAGPSDPWLGTSLAGLMGSSNQPKRTLMGSQEIQSSTRAASGFGRAESESPSKKVKTAALDARREPELQPAPEPEIPTKVQPVVRNGQRFKVSEYLRVVEGMEAPVLKADNSQRTSASEAPKTNTTVAEPKTSQARPRPAARPARRKFTFDDDFDIDAISTPEPEPGRNPAKPTARRKVKVEIKEENKTNFSDIPTFLF